MNQPAIIVLVNLLILTKQIYSQSSPCPEIFRYESDGQRNYGIVTIPGPGVGRTIMQAKIGIRGPVYNRGSGGLRLVKSLDASVEDARRGRDIQYIVNFPQSQQLPIIMKLTLNNVDICNGPAVNNAPTWTFQHEFTYPSGVTHLSNIPPFRTSNSDSPVVFMPEPEQPDWPWITPTRPPPSPRTPTPRPPTPRPPTPSPPTPRPPTPPVSSVGSSRPSDGSWLGSLPFAGTCGRRPESLSPTQLIIGGVGVNVGEFPWMVALFHYKGRATEYKCGASLISNTYVITAAHCIQTQRRVYLELGRHDISNPAEDGYVPRVSLDIIPHPEYVTGAHGDVALILIEHVEFTPKIKPICLWAQGTNLDNLLRQGTVTGWGRVENDGDMSTTPMKLNVRTVGLDTCRNSHETLRDIATDKTFCAGGNNSGPCHGDSGSGFYIRHGDVWYLRGIISTSLGNDFVCNLSEYAVYVDLAFYLDWLRPYLLP